MKIYIGKNKRKAKEISFYDLLTLKLKEAGFKPETGMFSDESASWIEVVQQKGKNQTTVNFLFDDGLENIDVYLAKIITIVDEDHQIKLT